MKKSRQKGFTLIEVMIAVLILGIGLLGLAGMQATSLRNNHQSYLRSQATMFTHELIDRMRANKAGFAIGKSAYDLATAVQEKNCTNNTGCTPQQMAKHDIWEWQKSISVTFPGCGDDICGLVCIDRTPDDGTPGTPSCQNDFTTDEREVYAIKIWWNDPAAESSNELQRFVMAVQP